MVEIENHSIVFNAADPFRARADDSLSLGVENEIHWGGDGIICATDVRGFAIPENHDPFDIVVDAKDGVIPLWAQGSTLRWRFQDRSFDVYFEKPHAAKLAAKRMFAKGYVAWGDAAPVRFIYDEQIWDFEIVVARQDSCRITANGRGCVQASAFFPDGGRHELTLYPQLFTQPEENQFKILAHELGHIFGLRHFFANTKETDRPSLIFGRHEEHSIMNYGSYSNLTDADREDLKALYTRVWKGELTDINGTRIKLVRPFSSENFRWTRGRVWSEATAS